MKFSITMKDPDGFHECLNEAVKDSVGEMNLPPDEVEEIEEIRMEKMKELLSKWFEYEEYLTVEIDTDAKTCVVVPYK